LSTISPNKGFTLLEVLIALLLMAILSGALYGTYFTAVKSRDRATSQMEPLRDVRQTLDMLRREIDAAFYASANKRLHFVVEDKDIFGKPASTIDFTTITTPLAGGIPSSDVIEVRYEPSGDERNMILNREEKDIYLENQPVPYPQIDKIQGFLVECYNGGSWVKSWDTASALNNSLPQAVRVTITIQDGDNSSDYSIIAIPRTKDR
jgi:general secretion pathway protein J